MRTARAKGVPRKPHDVGARAAQRRDPDPYQRHGPAAGVLAWRVPDRAFFLHSRHRPRSDSRGRAQRFPGDQGGHGLCRDRDHVR